MNAAIKNLASETQLLALLFKDAYDAVRRDARIISRLPAMKGLMRSIENDGLDPVDGYTTAVWRKNVEETFASIMQENPNYTQIRYIGLANKGRELVRVNRTGKGLVVVPVSKLQEKGMEPYVQAVNQGHETFFFTKVTANREYGVQEKVLIPTIRAVMPIKDTKNKLFGLAVINVDFEGLMRKMFESARPKQAAYLTNQSGDYVEYNPKEQTFRLEYHQGFTKKQPNFIKTIKSYRRNEAIFKSGRDIISYVKMRIDKRSANEYVGAVIRVPLSDLLKNVYIIRHETILLSTLLVIVFAMVAALIAHFIIAPMVRMTDDIQKHKHLSTKFMLPVDRQDEVGNLARAFQNVINQFTESETARRAYIDASGDGYWDWMIQDNYEYMSPRFWQMFGYKPEEKEAKPEEWQKLIFEEDLQIALDNFKKHVNSKGKYPYSQEVRYRHKNGSIITVLCKGTVIEWDNNIPVRMIGTHTDLSALKKTEAQLEARNNELSRLSRQLKQLNLGLEKEVEKRVHEFKKVNEELLAFTYIISHDFREPLRGIRQFSEIINDEYKHGLPEEAQQYIDIIYNSAIKSTDLLDSLTQFSKIGKETDADIANICNITDIVNRILDEFKQPIKSKNIKFDVSDNLPLLKGPNSHFYELLRNLIENSIKYSDDKKEDCCILIYYNDRDNTLYIEDNGIGIPEEKIEECEKVFYKLNPKTNGSGMGLAICKKLCLVSNIDFSIKGNKMGGLTVILKIPKKLL